MLRILHVLDHSIPLQSGYAFRTLSILKEQRAAGWETVQLTTPRQGASEIEEEIVDGWHFFRTPFNRNWTGKITGLSEMREMLVMAARIGCVVEKVKPDIIHAHSPVLNILPALWCGRRRRLPVVYELRALWEDAAVDHGTTNENSLRYLLSRRAETFALRHAAHVTTICEGLRLEIEGRGIAPDAVTVIPNAVDIKAFSMSSKADERLRNTLGLDGNTVLGFVGSFYAYEGIDLIIDALAEILPQRPKTKLLLVGGGSHEPILRRRTQELGLVDHVVFTGRVPNSEVQRYYDLIDVLVYPRRSMRLTELVTPLKPLEAMAQGRIVLASDVGGHRELILHGETGYLFPAGDASALAKALHSLLERRSEWERIRQVARHFVETERSWQRSVARYGDVYRRVLENHAKDTGTGVRGLQD